jgi:hypothetical protein
MSSSTRKRKHRPTAHINVHSSDLQINANITPNTTASDLDPALFIQAHEADVIRGPQARIAAKSLEVDINDTHLTVGDALIRWGGIRENVAERRKIDDDNEWKEEQEAVWVDRYALSEISNQLSLEV